MKKLFFLLLIGFNTVVAQQKLTLDDAVNIALKNSMGIQISKNNLKIAGINNNYGIAGGLPLVTATGSNTQQLINLRQKYNDPSKNTATDNASSNNLSANVTATELVYNAGRVVTAKKRLGEIESQSKQVLNSRALFVVYNVMLKYYDIIRQESYARTLERSIDASKQKLEIVKTQQSVGMANNADLFQAQVDLNTQQQNLKAQQLIVDQGKTDLLTLLTLNPDSTVTIEDTIVVDKKLQLASILSGVANNPDIVAANEQVTINRYIEKETGALRYPSLGVNGGFNLSRTQNSGVSQYSAILNENYGPFVGISLNIPIFNGTIYKRQQQVATVNTQNAALLRDTLALGYTANAVKSWQAYQNNLQQLEMAVENYNLSQQLLDLIIKRFQLHQATIVDVKNAQQSFENAGYLLTNTSYAAKAAEIQLKRFANQLSY
ncbi:MAG: TolC family protein [Bacteroidetes bacterium]|nr:TolC family protein [Bacteroidota bacterium]